MKAYFIKMMDDLRGFCGFPIRISKGGGYRTEEYNQSIGGAPQSYHTRGEAADIRCSDSAKRYAIVRAAITAGFRSIEICDAHVHVDGGDKYKMWTDKSK